MGEYKDFDLDIKKVKSVTNSAAGLSDLDCISLLSELTSVMYCSDSDYCTSSTAPSTDCSPSDMTACELCWGVARC